MLDMRNYDFYKIRKKNIVAKDKSLTIDLEKVSITTCRTLGPELAGNSTWDRLSMDTILKDVGLDKKSREIAKAVVLARLISPASEAGTLKWIK